MDIATATQIEDWAKGTRLWQGYREQLPSGVYRFPQLSIIASDIEGLFTGQDTPEAAQLRKKKLGAYLGQLLFLTRRGKQPEPAAAQTDIGNLGSFLFEAFEDDANPFSQVIFEDGEFVLANPESEDALEFVEFDFVDEFEDVFDFVDETDIDGLFASFDSEEDLFLAAETFVAEHHLEVPEAGLETAPALQESTTAETFYPNRDDIASEAEIIPLQPRNTYKLVA